MSDQPDSAVEPANPAALRDGRWLAGGIWGALLLTLVTTSGYGIKAFSDGSIASRYIGLPLDGSSEASAKVAAVLGVVLSTAAALLILAAWRAFVRTTNVLISALADSNDDPDEAPVPADWMMTDAKGAVFTAAGEVVQFVGLAWAVMVVTPALLGLSVAFG